MPKSAMTLLMAVSRDTPLTRPTFVVCFVIIILFYTKKQGVIFHAPLLGAMPTAGWQESALIPRCPGLFRKNKLNYYSIHGQVDRHCQAGFLRLPDSEACHL